MLLSFIKLTLEKSYMEIHRNYCCQEVCGGLDYLNSHDTHNLRKYQHQRYEEYTLTAGGKEGSYGTEAEALVKLVYVG